MKRNDQSNLTELLANEQTFLAWLRTSIEVMAFGFVAIKFSLFASQVIGILLVGAGAMTIALAYFRYRSTVKKIKKSGIFMYDTYLLTIVAAALLVISAVLLVCLIDVYLKEDKNKSNAETGKSVSDLTSMYVTSEVSKTDGRML